MQNVWKVHQISNVTPGECLGRLLRWSTEQQCYSPGVLSASYCTATTRGFGAGNGWVRFPGAKETQGWQTKPNGCIVFLVLVSCSGQRRYGPGV